MTTTHGWVTRLGFLLGVVAVAVVAWSGRLPQGSGTAGADVTFTAATSGELAVTPAGPFARGLGLEPGHARTPADGEVTVHNSTGTAADVHVRVLRSISDLDALLHVDVRAAGSTVYSGPLGGLQSWSTATFRVARGGDARLAVSADLPASVRDGYQSRIADLTLEFRLDAVEA
jgi:hypothetical protein